MKSAVAAVLALAAFAAAQSPPKCATDCVASSPTSCSQSDLSCLCHDNNFITKATQCILTTCQGSDVQAAEVFAQGLCASVGVTLTSTPPIPTGTSTGAASSGSSTDSTAPTSSGSSSDTATATAPSSSQTNSASDNGSSTISTTASQTTPASSPTTSGGSAAGLEAGFTGLVGAVFAYFLL